MCATLPTLGVSVLGDSLRLFGTRLQLLELCAGRLELLLKPLELRASRLFLLLGFETLLGVLLVDLETLLQYNAFLLCRLPSSAPQLSTAN